MSESEQSLVLGVSTRDEEWHSRLPPKGRCVTSAGDNSPLTSLAWYGRVRSACGSERGAQRSLAWVLGPDLQAEGLG